MKNIEIKVEFTDGYEKRFTEACLRQLAKRKTAGYPEKDQAQDCEEKTA